MIGSQNKSDTDRRQIAFALVVYGIQRPASSAQPRVLDDMDDKLHDTT